MGKEGYLSINNTKIYYKVFGKGMPLLFVHGGMGLDCSYFEAPSVLNLVKHNIQVILFDQRGHGRSQRCNEEYYTHKLWVSDLKQIIKKLKLKKTNLVGHSYGGWIALEYAVTQPKSLERLILVDTHVGPVDIEGIPKYGNNKEMIERGRKFWPKSFFGRNKHWNVFRRMIQSYKPFNSAYHREAKNYDVRKKLSKIEAKTLVICGKNDSFFLERSKKFVKKIKCAKLKVIPNCGHYPFIERPEIFTRIVTSFLK